MRKSLKKISSRLQNIQKKDYLISEESAMDEICKFLDYYDIDIESLEMTENTEIAGERIIDSLIKFYRTGQIKNQEDEKGFKIIHKLRSGDEITYNEVTAVKKRTMDKFETKEQYGRIHTFMGALCGLGFDGVDKLHATDLQVLEVLGSIFLLV